MIVSDWLIIGAIIIGPTLAVQIQKFKESKKEEKERKMRVFKTLMTTRATPLSPYHVETLNMIDIEFYKSKKIKEAWKLLLDNFANYPKDTKAPDFQTKLNFCSERSKELLTDLLYEMAKSLGYDFDKVHLKRGAYIPQGHADIEFDQLLIRQGMVDLLYGKKSLSVDVGTPLLAKSKKPQKKRKVRKKKRR